MGLTLVHLVQKKHLEKVCCTDLHRYSFLKPIAPIIYKKLGYKVALGMSEQYAIYILCNSTQSRLVGGIVLFFYQVPDGFILIAQKGGCWKS
jgi:hypothetical protein